MTKAAWVAVGTISLFFGAVGGVAIVEGPAGQSGASGANQPIPIPEENQHAANPDDFDTELVEQYFFEAQNEHRLEENVDPLKSHPRLQNLSRYHAADLAEHEMGASHDSSDGRTFTDRVEQYGICDGASAENVQYFGFKYRPTPSVSEEEVIENTGWEPSQPHYEGHIDETYEYTGVGVAVSENGAIVIVQTYCSESPRPVE